MIRFCAWTVALLATVFWAASPANASMLLNQNYLATSSSADSAPELDISGAGTLTVTVTDQNSLSPFSSLQFFLGSVSTALTPMQSAGTPLSLDLTAPQKVYVDVLDSLGPSGYGIYNIAADFSPSAATPAPGSLICFLGAGLLLLRGQLRNGGLRSKLS